MNGNVEKFFYTYDRDPELQARVKTAEALYPGSLELREALVEAVLLPEAEAIGLPFTVDELRKYELALKAERERADENAPSDEDDEDDEDDDEQEYWLLGRGWSSDEARFCGDED